jgi:hypothetical protein
MGILDWWRRSEQRLDAENVSEELIREATDWLVKITNPRLTVVRRYRNRLEPAVEAAIVYLRGLAARLLPEREATAAGWNADPALRAFFATPDDLLRAFSRSGELRDYFDQAPDQPSACAVLSMVAEDRKVLGMKLQGDLVQRDVALTTLCFSDYKVRIVARNVQELRREIGRRILEQLALRALEAIGAIKGRRRDLENQRALLKARLRILQGQSMGMRAVVAEAPSPSEADQQELEAMLEQNEQELKGVALGPDALDRELECLRETLIASEKGFTIDTRRLRLDPMNVILDDPAAEPGRDVEFNVFELAGKPPLRRAFALARFARTDLLSPEFMQREALQSLR